MVQVCLLGTYDTNGSQVVLRNYNPNTDTYENRDTINTVNLTTLLNDFQDLASNVNLSSLAIPPPVQITHTAQPYTVKFTFFSKNCDQRNAFGYIHYMKNSVPTTWADVDWVYILEKNCDLSTASGNLTSGDFFFAPCPTKFQSATEVTSLAANDYSHPSAHSMSPVIVANGWDGNTLTINADMSNVYTGIPPLNPEISMSYRCHFLSFPSYDVCTGMTTFGCEDMNNEANSDADFCDLWFGYQKFI